MKKKVLTTCLQIVAEKLKNLKNGMSDLRESASQDSKSSVGDKYETSRAMIHLEQENLMSQYNEVIRIQNILTKINSDIDSEIGGVGSLIETDNGNFYISVGLGKIDVDKYSIFAIAPNSPLGNEFLGKKVGDKIELNNLTYSIKNIE